MPPKPLSALLLLCDRVLHEKDELVSAIRIADLFFVHFPPDVPPEKQVVLMNILVMCKFAHDDDSKHSITLQLRRPDGQEKDIDFGMPLEVSLAEVKPKTPQSPRGFNLIGPWGVKATHMGLHQVNLLVDGEKITSTFFTLAPLPAQAKE